MSNAALYSKLVRDLARFFKQEGRSHLPWRQTRDPYKILVSEIMLQQTQVDRVVPYYKRWVKKYPTAQALAKAKLPEVLLLWQGLGYNRRAKYLHEAAKVISETTLSRKKSGLAGATRELRRTRRPEDFWRDSVVKLPGVGPYTRSAVMAFAFNEPEVFIETNIRTVLFHHLENIMIYHSKISDAQLLPIVKELLVASAMQPRDFYAALMDYGSYLKRQGVKLNSRSSHYAKQSKFEGSARQLRGAILRELLAAPATRAQLQKKIPRSAGEIEMQLRTLVQERLVTGARGRYRIAG